MALGSQTAGLRVQVTPDGRYSMGQPGASEFALTAGVAAKVNGGWLHSGDYPKHAIRQTQAQGELGEAKEWDVTASGLAGAPNLVYRLRAYPAEPFADLQVTVRNARAGNPCGGIRAVDAAGTTP